MRNFILSFFTSIVVAFLLLLFSHMGIIPWDKIIPVVYRVPDLRGLNKYAAEIVCRVKNMTMKITNEVYSEKYLEGTIISQTPREFSKTKLPEINVTLSKGEPVTSVPDLKGLTLDEAKKMLKSLSLISGDISYIDSSEEKGKVVSSSPQSGTEVQHKQSVDIIISKGQSLTVVPNVVGKNIYRAKKLLSDKGLILGYIKKTTDIERMFGVILKQHPPAGKKVPRGTSMTVILNEEEE